MCRCRNHLSVSSGPAGAEQKKKNGKLAQQSGSGAVLAAVFVASLLPTAPSPQSTTEQTSTPTSTTIPCVVGPKRKMVSLTKRVR